MNFYRKIGHIENEVVALSLQYELKHYLGDFTKADEAFNEAEHLIETYELADKKRRLYHLKNKGTTHETISVWIADIFAQNEAVRNEYETLVSEMQWMDEEERKQKIPKGRYYDIHLFPIGYFQFPEKSTAKVYEIIGVADGNLKMHFDQLFKELIPVANIYYSEIKQEGFLDGKLADKGIENWRNIHRVRKAFYENKFYRNETIP